MRAGVPGAVAELTGEASRSVRDMVLDEAVAVAELLRHAALMHVLADDVENSPAQKTAYTQLGTASEGCAYIIAMRCWSSNVVGMLGVR